MLWYCITVSSFLHFAIKYHSVRNMIKTFNTLRTFSIRFYLYSNTGLTTLTYPDPTKVNSVTLWSVSRRPGSNWGAERRANVGAWSGRLRVRHRANLQHITTDTDIFTALEFQVIISSQCHDHWLGLLSLKPRQCSAVDREQRKTSASCWGKVQCDIWDGFLQIGKSRFSVHMTPHHCRHVQPRSSRLVLMFCLKLRCDDRQTSLRTTLVHWLHKDA